MKKLLTKSHSQRGFTLIELLIVVAILGIIAAVAIPNVGAFMGSATLNAANSEAANVKTAALAYYAEKSPPTWPLTAGPLTAGDLADYLTGSLVGTYAFDSDGLIIESGTSYPDLVWNFSGQKFVKPSTP